MAAEGYTHSGLEAWAPPRKRLALQASDGEPCCLPSPIDETVTIITPPKTLLRHHQPELAQYIHLETLLPHLNHHYLLTDDENEVLLNLVLTQRVRVLKLLQFMESKGPDGFQKFLKAIADEPEHMGHRELTKLFAPYRCEIPCKPRLVSIQSVSNCVALHAAMRPIQGAEFDLDEAVIQSSQKQESSSLEASGREGGIIEMRPSASASKQTPEQGDVDTELLEIKECIEHDHPDTACTSTQIVRKYPNRIFPSGPMKKKSHSLIYTSLFKMAWGGDENKALSVMRHLRRNRDISVDLKIVSMEVVHTVNTERDLKVLTSALAYTDRPACENTCILKCRLHRRIAGLHYRNSDLEEANEHMDTALQLAHNIGPDIDTIYTMRLKALMLFEDYKKTKNRDSYRDANKFFTKAMEHARLQPESKRVITERVKVSKALFHLDMREEYRQQDKAQDTLMELEYRAEETLEDVEEDYLTDGDKAFFYLTRAKLCVCSKDWRGAQVDAERALDLNQRCGLEKRAGEAQEFLTQIRATRSAES